MREYMAQRKLHDMALWRTEPVAEENSRERKHFSLRGVCMEAAKIAAVLAIVLLGTHYWTGNIRYRKTNMAVYLCAGGPTGRIDVGGWYEGLVELTQYLDFPGKFQREYPKCEIGW